jgi:hypothetical protein
MGYQNPVVLQEKKKGPNNITSVLFRIVSVELEILQEAFNIQYGRQSILILIRVCIEKGSISSFNQRPCYSGALIA